MTIIEQIKTEINKRYTEYSEKQKTDNLIYYEGMADALDLFEQFIDTLEPEKPVSDDLKKEVKKYISKDTPELWTGDDDYEYTSVPLCWMYDFARHFAEWGAEHLANARKTLSNDLEEAAWEYAPDLPSYNIGGGYLPPQSRDDLRIAFRDGAKWQAEKDVRDMCMSDNRHFEKVYQLGRTDMREQMLKDAIEGEVAIIDYPNRYKFIDCEVPQEFNEGDKVKIIIVKEDSHE